MRDWILKALALVVAVGGAFFLPWPAGSLTAQDTADGELERASGGRTVALRPLSGGRVTDVPLEIYVSRVLAGEAEPGAPDATMQALAVAVRTFAIFNMGRHGRDGFDFCDTTHCQVPRTSNAETRRAALATAGRILTYRGAPAEVFYSASCGGRSESAAAVWPRSNLPYLQVVEDDVHRGDVPWQLERTLDEIADALDRVGFEGTRLRDVEITDRTDSGRVARLKLTGLRPDVVTGEQFRSALGARELQSTAFSIRRRGETVTFTGRGYGHGVGMCVIGAGRRARRGETAADILAHYYPGLEVSSLRNTPPVRLESSTPANPPAIVRAPSAGVTVRVPAASPVTVQELERLALTARDALAKALGTPPVPVTVQLHASLDSFRNATSQPWWVSAVANGATIDMAPAVLVAQREGVETALRVALAEQLVAPSLIGRPAWVAVGAARYFARKVTGAPAMAPASRSTECPSDAEVRLAISATAQREAERRAEACFAREYSATGDWKAVK